MKLTDSRFRYHNAASHCTSEGLRKRMKRYAKQVQPKVASVTQLKRKAK